MTINQLVEIPFNNQILEQGIDQSARTDFFNYNLFSGRINAIQYFFSELKEELKVKFFLKLLDEKTRIHSQNVSKHTKNISKALVYLGWIDESHINLYSRSAKIHDIGKRYISKKILFKPGKLTYEEKLIMQDHTLYVPRIIKKMFSEEVYKIARHHHEKYNGSGYPDGLKDRDISLGTKIVTIADCYDALVSKRSYKDPFNEGYVKDYINSKKGQYFDPRIVKIFLELLPSKN